MVSAPVVWLQPTETLQAYFKACDEDVTPGVLKRLQELSNTIFPLPEGPSGVAFQSTMARERRLEVGHRSHDPKTTTTYLLLYTLDANALPCTRPVCIGPLKLELASASCHWTTAAVGSIITSCQSTKPSCKTAAWLGLAPGTAGSVVLAGLAGHQAVLPGAGEHAQSGGGPDRQAQLHRAAEQQDLPQVPAGMRFRDGDCLISHGECLRACCHPQDSTKTRFAVSQLATDPVLSAATPCQHLYGRHAVVMSGRPVHVSTGECKSAAGLGNMEFPCQKLECTTALGCVCR